MMFCVVVTVSVVVELETVVMVCVIVELVPV